MELSKFSIVIPNNDTVILYNTMKKKYIEIPMNLYERIKSKFHNKFLEMLFKDYLRSDKNEDILFEYFMNTMIYQSNRLNLTIMMTMDCNFKCVYCFEGWIENRTGSTKLDEDKISNWIIEMVKKYHFNYVDICFHGGEPLLEIDKIEKISIVLSAFFERNKVQYIFTAVTNGYLLNEVNVLKLYQSKIKIVQITIDGTKDVHDMRRPLKNGSGTFETIVNNIKANKYLSCYLNIVYDVSNYRNVYELIDYLRINLSDSISMIIIGDVKPIIHNSFIDNNIIEQRESARIRLDIMKKIITSGFNVPFDLDYQLCTLKQKGAFVITPDSNIYKCISGVGMSEFYLCQLNDMVDPIEKQAFFFEKNTDLSCKNCCYKPLCNGYCFYERHVTNKGKICHRSFWDEYVPLYIKMCTNKKYRDKIIMSIHISEMDISYK
jgi:uncharacterized protein